MNEGLELRSPQEVLAAMERAAERYREHRCTGTFARRADGEPCPATSRDAVSWCVVGAVRVEAEFRGPFYLQLRNVLNEAAGVPDVCMLHLARVSDRSQEEGDALFAKAIEIARSRVERRA